MHLVVDDAPQRRKQIGDAMHLVEADEPSRVQGAVLFHVEHLGEIARPLQVRVDAIAQVNDGAGKRRLADLARPKEHDGWVRAQEAF